MHTHGIILALALSWAQLPMGEPIRADDQDVWLLADTETYKKDNRKLLETKSSSADDTGTERDSESVESIESHAAQPRTGGPLREAPPPSRANDSAEE